jgi:LacI family transcriptional regulator
MVTQDRIAAELNLSKSTVSRILSGKSVFDDETRARVLTMAAKLGYRHLRPTVRSRPKYGSKVTLVGIIIEEEITELATPVIPVVATRALRGMSEVARMDEIAIHVDYFTQEQTARLHLREHQPPLLKKGRFSGLLLHGRMNVTTIEELARQLPCVRVNDREPEVPVDCIGQNDTDATEALVRHLHSLGHRRIGFLTEAHRHHWPYRARLAGCWLALRHLGIEFGPELVVERPTSKPPAPAQWEYAHTRVLEQVRQGTSAWICVHDALGYRLVRYLQNQGLRVPQDVAVCGFDNLPLPDKDLPRLTTIDWPFEDIGAAAMRRLLRRILEPTEAQVYMMFNGRLIPGPSTMPELPVSATEPPPA